ncbi:DNA cytosine methyltransferase [Heyndrickxia coagulans]|jgi:DNA (cytosine-5)-methyltransferase 1|uniref:DNA cytosine methyltransferase n=1 Tax=Heyndrickxia TaxID=2837504 RepID=UPI0007792F8A|nr:DNA cytosine methyltransferase [Heyndrickxia coagulans]KYC60138.1 DNA-cytosine methyltransferase [Heyndrickxia coagulans]UXC21883.1 DNA cytosine methyltransferase [Heyndrickxia coagulans]
MKLRVIDLFAGIGGLSLGFRMEGFNIVLANEIDKEIADSYVKNHPETKMINEDITRLNVEEVFKEYANTIDVVIGGPPCQGFSQKGQRKSINDERNFLFKYFYNVVNFIKPRYFLMENVPNLLTTENGYFKKEIEILFNGIGYTLNSNVLNAADFGIPQNRKRAFILGKLGNIGIELPKPLNIRTTIWDAISDLAYLESGEGDFKQEYRFDPQSAYQQLLRKNSKFLYNHVATRHSEIALERLKMIPPNKGREVLPEEHLTKSIYSGTWTRMVKEEVAVTITTRFDTPSSGKFTHPFLNRAITVREAARLQSFPDEFIFYGTKGSQMKQVGNAVPPLLSKQIAAEIKKDILNTK